MVSLYPGLVRTETVLKNAEFFDLSNSESPQFIGRAVAALASDPNIKERSGKWLFDLSNSESPQFIGRAVAALASDPNIKERSGKWLVAAELGHEYGFSDVDGARPRSFRNDFVEQR